MVTGLLAGIGAALLFGLGAVLQAAAVRGVSDEETSSPWRFVVTVVRHPLMVLVVLAYLAGFGLHAVAIQLLPLYLAQAGIALSLPVTALSVGLVGERATARQGLAVLLVVAGLVVLSASAGAAGEVRRSAGFVAVVAVAAGLTLLAALAGRRGPGWVLATLAGIAFAGSAVAVRGVAWPAYATVGSMVALATVGAFGLAGFWTYSLALDRSPVSVATAPMVVGEVCGPALIGLALLGDQVRTGWWAGIAVGLACAVAGAVIVHAPDDARATAQAS